MNRVTRGTVVLAAMLATLSCKGDPTSSLRNGVDHLIAVPSAIYVGNSTTKTVLVTAYDAQGNALATNFSVASVGPNITVTPDDSFNLVYNTSGQLVPPKNWTRAQFIVGVSVFDTSSFVITAGGKSVTIPVRTAAASLTGPVSNLSPNNGDTVTITAPANLNFDAAASLVIFASDTAVVTDRTTSTISFVPPPGASGPATVTKVGLDYEPTAGTFSVPTSSDFHVAPIPDLIAAPTTALVGDTITVTIPAPFKWSANSHVIIPGASAIVVTGISPDSGTVKFRIGPNADTTISIDSTVVSGVPGLGRFELVTAGKLSSPLVPTFPVTFSKSTPALGDTVVITAAAGFKFLPTASFTIGGFTPVIVSRAADSSAITFIPYPTGGIAAPVVLSNVVFANAPTLPLTMTSSASIKAAAETPFAGATAVATAPQLNIPATGQITTYVDVGPTAAAAECGNIGFHCRFYKLVLAAPRTFNLSLRWGNTADIGGYFIDAAGNDLFGDFACDAKGSGAGGQPEACTETLAAGTYYLALADFTSATAQNTSWRITFTGQ